MNFLKSFIMIIYHLHQIVWNRSIFIFMGLLILTSTLKGKKKWINPQVRSTEIGSNLFSLKEKQKREIANEIMPMKSLASDATSWSFNSETLPPPPPPPIISQRSRYRNESFREMNAPSTPNQLKIQNDKISIFKNFIINEILKFKWFQFLTLS